MGGKRQWADLIVVDEAIDVSVEKERTPLVGLEIVACTDASKDTVGWWQAGIVGGHKRASVCKNCDEGDLR